MSDGGQLQRTHRPPVARPRPRPPPRQAQAQVATPAAADQPASPTDIEHMRVRIECPMTLKIYV